MNRREVANFLESTKQYTEQDIISNIDIISEYLRMLYLDDRKVKYLKKLFKIADKNKLLYEMFKNEEKFCYWKKKLDFPDKLKYGLEIEVAHMPLEVMKFIFDSKIVSYIMEILEVPANISEMIIENSDFEKKDEFYKWIFSKEIGDVSEASSPIMYNNLEDLNQIVAICTLYKSLGGTLHGGTGLHINVGADYFECNEKAIENLLKIWGDCEELFFKIANPEEEIIRVFAQDMASPIKENIQNFFEEDGSVSLNTEEDMEKFLYQIQARNHMYDFVAQENLGIEYDLNYAETEEEKFEIFHRYNEHLKKLGSTNSSVRFTSINFNHINWNTDDAGRIEFRIFNSSLEPEIIFQDLLLVGKLVEVSLKNAKNPDYKKDEFETLFLCNVTETEKVNNLLNLLFDTTEQKNIFKKRWQSVRRNDNYNKYKSGKDTFERQ